MPQQAAPQRPAPASSPSGVALPQQAAPQRTASSPSGVAMPQPHTAPTAAAPAQQSAIQPRAPSVSMPQQLPPQRTMPQPANAGLDLPPAPSARVAPPSPIEFAQQRAPTALPQVTPIVPTHGAVVPEGGLSPNLRPQPVTAPAPKPELQVHDEPELRTLPQAAPAPRPPPPAAARPPNPLPTELLVTQPGMPGPFAARELSAAQPKIEQPSSPAASSDTVTAEPAALWRRVGAWLTDLLFVSVMALSLLFVAMQVIAPKNLTPLQQLSAIAIPGVALAALLAFVYTTLFAFLWDGRTPGRRMMGIHLVDTTGHAPAPLRALVRAGLSLVSFGLFLSGFWLALFDRHGQTLHDKLTRTFVVKLQDA
jgi:uncharacterized RDD family membrane protein YckC